VPTRQALRAASTARIRFSGGDLEERWRSQMVLDGGRSVTEALTYVEIGRDGYIRDDPKRGTVFSRRDPSADSDFPHHVATPAQQAKAVRWL
jgi:hypothetical protein